MDADTICSLRVLIRNQARRFTRNLPPGVVDKDDLIGAGWVAVLTLSRAYDTGHEMLFNSRYLCKGIRREMQRELALASGYTGRAARHRGFSYCDRRQPLPLDDEPGPKYASVEPGPEARAEDASERAFIGHALRDALAKLPEGERALVLAHYFRGQKLSELGRKMGVTRQRASQIHAQALARLRRRLADECSP